MPGLRTMTLRPARERGAMKFTASDARWPPENARSQAFLERDNWDDYTYKTLWTLRYVDATGTVHTIGGVKIAQFGQEERSRTTLNGQFTELPEDYFSLGQDEDYYLNLQTLGDAVRLEVLKGLRDIALDIDLFVEAIAEDVTRTSLMRSISANEVQNQFHRMARGGARLSPYAFAYLPPVRNEAVGAPTSSDLVFEVRPQSRPPTNVHVIIGRNGMGKSFLLNNITNALIRGETSVTGSVEFHQPSVDTEASRFANVVSVAFSAFDQFEPLRHQSSAMGSLRYSYIGLKAAAKKADESSSIKGFQALATEFALSVKACVAEPRRSRWRRALEVLQSDPMFADQISRFIDERDEERLRAEARDVFWNMSSGHKIVLLTITRLVETVEEATLVLLDEPESHLHPPLLAAFVRALSELLEDRNGVALIATHSPVILQEVPQDCVYKIRRVGDVMLAARPEIETYGENVGTLTQEVFGLEVTASGFHRTLQELVESGASYEEVVAMFDGRLGFEARSLIQAMTIARRS
jgi:predicted ATPase